ncbi:MAG: RNA-binding protein [Planctomycetes bacterium]|nr:RNA-binding protein [Planctomycetota bacterium]
MGKRLYVGNLPYDADEAGLRELFAQDGRVVERVHIVLDRETQKPRGFAFIEMGSEEQARAALASLDGTMFGMRNLRISEAEDRRPGGAGGPGGGGFGGGAGGPRGPRPDRPTDRSGDRPMGRPAPGPRQASGDGGSYGGGGGGGGGWADDRGPRFGPDAKPKRERDKEFSKKPKRRFGDDGDDDFGGRRRGHRFDDDDGDGDDE